MKISKLLPFVSVFILSAVFAADRLETLLSMPARKMEIYRFNPASSLISRVRLPEAFVFEFLTNNDQDTGYRPYMPDSNEMILLERYLSMLPPLNRRVLKERLLGLYVIENFQGSGLADFVLDKNTNFYFTIVINRALFKRSLSEQFIYRERTCFRTDNSGLSVNVDCGTNESALLYILLHESTHAVDYVSNITPYVEPATVRFMKQKPRHTAFTKDVWTTRYEMPTAGNIFAMRDDVTFYNMNNGPKIPLSNTIALYQSFANSPFVSLYGSLNWAEDLAEMVTLYTLTEKLKLPYRIIIESNGRPLGIFEPAKNPRVTNRFPALELFYRE